MSKWTKLRSKSSDQWQNLNILDHGDDNDQSLSTLKNIIIFMTSKGIDDTQFIFR